MQEDTRVFTMAFGIRSDCAQLSRVPGHLRFVVVTSVVDLMIDDHKCDRNITYVRSWFQVSGLLTKLIFTFSALVQIVCLHVIITTLTTAQGNMVIPRILVSAHSKPPSKPSKVMI